MRKLLLVLMALTFGAAHASNEEAPRPPWLNVDVLKAAIAIDMTDEQKPQFQQAVSDLVNNRAKAINKIMRRNNVTDLRRKLDKPGIASMFVTVRGIGYRFAPPPP